MHPADEFVAMAALIDAGAVIEDVATRFGTSERHVRQRLRLGKLAPELLDAYRAGKISLDTVTAFTLGADHAAQRAVWNQLKDNSYIQSYTVKRLLTDSAVPLDSDLGQFVGARAYEAAGGRITRDLFSGDEDGFMDDAALVRRLAIEKLEAKAAELRPQWAWTKAVLDLEYGFMTQYARVRPQPAEVPAPLAAEIDRIEQRLGGLEAVAEDDFTDELLTEAAQLEERRNVIDETIEGLAVYSDRDRARAGCIVTIGDDGEFCLHQGLVDRATMRNAVDGGDPDAQTDDDGDEAFAPPSDDDEDDDPDPRPSSPGAEQALRKECGFSQLLVDDLKAHRLQVTRAHLAADFGVAFDLALYALCIDLFDRFRYQPRPLDLRASESTPRSSLNDLSSTPADQLICLDRHRHRFRFAPWRHALGLLREFLESGNRPAQKAEALLQFGNPSGQFLSPTGGRPRQSRPQPAKRAEEQKDEENGGNPARNTDPLEHSHRRLQYEAEHKGEHDRQKDLGSHITGRQHREKKKATQKYRLDIRWYGQIVFVSGRRRRRRDI
jgi:ParB family chromosome partitioning protein